MLIPTSQASMHPADLEDLRKAVKMLETPGFVARVANVIGVPVEAVLRRLPASATDLVRQTVTTALERCMDAALFSFQTGRRFFSSNRLTKAAVAATGATGGAFGLAALPIELPVTTSLMLRSIAEIASRQGEDVHSPEGRVACLEVLALGSRSKDDDDSEIGYFAVRAALAQEVTAAIRFLNSATQRQTAPALIRLIEAVAARFGIVVSQKAAAGAIPVIGAIGGAGVNALFMDHYQDMAQGHFTVRRLERKYGAEAVRREYERLRAAS